MVAALIFVIYWVLTRWCLGFLLKKSGYAVTGSIAEEFCISILSPFLPVILLIGGIEGYFNK